MKKIFILLILAGLMSCSKSEKPQDKENVSGNQTGETENPSDTTMSAEEKFSSSILTDFIDDTDDVDLESYLEDELFKYSQNYRGASVIQLSNTLWFVTLENQNNVKNFLLQKFVDFNTNDYYFRLTETSLTIPDIIVSSNLNKNNNVLKKSGTSSKQQAK